MGIFEFVVGLYAIIAGLGISLLVQSIGQLIEARRRVRLYWVHVVWIGLIFVAHVSSWFSFWRFAGEASWTALEVILVLLVPILLYLVSHLAVPDLEDERSHDLRPYYYEHHRWMQGLMVAALAMTQAGQYAILGTPGMSGPEAVRAAAMVLLIPGILSSRPVVHGVQATLLAVLLVVTMSFIATPIG